MTSALPPAPWETSVPSLHTVWNKVGETSMCVPIGRDVKRGEEAPSKVETGVGSGAKTGQKHVFGVDTDGSREGTADTEDEGLMIVLAAGSWAEVRRTSFQPWCIF
jgi:hypothetical protein